MTKEKQLVEHITRKGNIRAEVVFDYVKKLKEEINEEISKDKIHLKNSLEKENYSEATLTDNLIYANEGLIEKIDKHLGEFTK